MTIDIWLVVGIPTPLKNDGVKVSWDDYSHISWENKKHVPTHQPEYILDGNWKVHNYIILYYQKTKH